MNRLYLFTASAFAAGCVVMTAVLAWIIYETGPKPIKWDKHTRACLAQ